MIRLASIALTALTLALAAGIAQAADAAKTVTASRPEAKADVTLVKVIQENFVSKGLATVEDVTERDDVQKVRSQFTDRNAVPAAVARKLEDTQLKTIHYPADNTWLGDWKEGERTMQSGRGMQFSDPAGTVSGANCYAYHRLSKDELLYGTTGPSLYQHGKLCGDPEAILRYTWGKIYNSNAYTVCPNMPCFGYKGILTEQQTRDVVALLFDPVSPVNQRPHNAMHTLRRSPMWMVAAMVFAVSATQTVEVGDAVALPEVQLPDGTRAPDDVWWGYPVIIITRVLWCLFCVLQNPRLRKLYDATRGTGLYILTISTDANPQLVKDYVARRDFTFPVMMETDALCAATDPRKGLPELFVFDAEGHAARKEVGEMSEDDVVDLARYAHSPK